MQDWRSTEHLTYSFEHSYSAIRGTDLRIAASWNS